MNHDISNMKKPHTFPSSKIYWEKHQEKISIVKNYQKKYWEKVNIDKIN